MPSCQHNRPATEPAKAKIARFSSHDPSYAIQELRRSSRLTVPQILDHGRLVASELDTLGLALALIGVHGVVILTQQRLNPGAMQVDRAATRLFRQRLIHQQCQALVTLAAESLADIDQTLLQTLGECSETALTLLGDEFGAEVDHVVLENPLDAPFQAVLQPDQRKFLHAVE